MPRPSRALWQLWLPVTGCAAVCSGVLAADDVAIALLFMTCGLGIPLLFLPTVAAYLACLAPSAMAAAFGLPRWAGAVASTGLLLTVAVLPGVCSRREAAAEVARATAGDVAGVAFASTRSLQIERPHDENANLPGAFFGDGACDPACRALLLGGEVDWVRVVTLDPHPRAREPEATDRVRLVRAAGADCDAPDAPAAPDTACVVFTPDTGEPADLVLHFRDGHREVDPPAPGAGWATPSGYRRVTVTRDGPGGPEVVLRRTEVRLGTIFSPTVLVAELNGMDSSGIEAVRTSPSPAPLRLPDVLRAVGFPLARLDAEIALAEARPRSGSTPPTEEATRQVVSILGLPPETPFSAAQQETVSAWLASSRGWADGGWTEGRVEVVRRIVREPRLTSAWSLDQIVERSPAVAAAVLPEVIDRTEALGLPLLTPWLQALYGLGRVDPALLEPHAAAFTTLLDAHPDRWELVVLAGRLRVDPSAWLLPLDPAADPDLLTARLRGACRAETRWSPLLVPHLVAFLDGLDPTDAHRNDHAELAAHALARHGDPDAARLQLERRGEDGRKTWRRLASDLKRRGPTDTLCR